MRELVNPVRDLFDATVRHYSRKFTCRGCRRQRVFPAASVWWYFHRRGIPDWLRDVPGKFRCTNCGRRSPAMELVHEEATDTGLPLPSERAWKEELRRRR